MICIRMLPNIREHLIWVSTDGSYTLKKEQETTKSKNTKTKNNKK